METKFNIIINYVLTKYIDILKCIGVYFIVLSTMVQLGIEEMNTEKKYLFYNPFIYFMAFFSVSLLVTSDEVILSFVGSILYFVVLFIEKKYKNYKTRKQNVMSKT
jgi:hypothetical protein